METYFLLFLLNIQAKNDVSVIYVQRISTLLLISGECLSLETNICETNSQMYI